MIKVILGVILIYSGFLTALGGRRHCVSIACGWDKFYPSCGFYHGRDYSSAWTTEAGKKLVQPIDLVGSK